MDVTSVSRVCFPACTLSPSKMDTRVASFAQTSLVEPAKLPSPAQNEYSDYSENLDSRLYELAERLVAMLDDEDDYSDSENFSTEKSSGIFGNFSSKNIEEDRLLLADSYTQCMQEALRFLIQDEGFPQTHEMVVGLQRHLEAQKSTAIERAVIKTQTKGDRFLIRGPAN